MTSTKPTRRGDTGKPGNAGKFDRHARSEGDPIDFTAAARRIEIDRLLDGCRNALGDPLTAEGREAIAAYATNGGDSEAWTNISGKLLRRHRTLWQGVLAHSDYNVRQGPTTTAVDHGFPPFRPMVTEQTADWAAVPTADQVLEGLRGIQSEDKPGIEYSAAGAHITHLDGTVGFIPGDADSRGWEE